MRAAQTHLSVIRFGHDLGQTFGKKYIDVSSRRHSAQRVMVASGGQWGRDMWRVGEPGREGGDTRPRGIYYLGTLLDTRWNWATRFKDTHRTGDVIIG